MASPNPGGSGNNPVIAGALTYPAGNSGNSQLQPLPEQPRQPRTLEGLLRFALEATRAEDAPGNSQLGPMDEERRRFLHEALNAQTVNIAEVLEKNIKILSDMEKISCIKKDERLPDEIFTAFRELGEYIDDIDVANDFEKLGGFIIFPMCQSCESVELHRWCNLTLAQVCQNNPRCQARALACRLMPVLLHRVTEHRQDDRSLRALSSMVRGFEPGLREFMAQGGCEALAAVLQADHHPELGTAVFLMAYLAGVSAEAREIFIRNNVIQLIACHLKAGRQDVSEYLLKVLVTLVEKQPAEVMAICRDPELDLKKIIESHLAIPDVAGGGFIEEKEYCEKILQAFEGGVMNGGSKEGVGAVEEADR